MIIITLIVLDLFDAVYLPWWAYFVIGVMECTYSQAVSSTKQED